MVSWSRVTLLSSHDHISQSCANFLQFSFFIAAAAGHHAKLDSSSSASFASSLSLSSISIRTQDFCPHSPGSLDVKSNYFILKVDSAEGDRKRKLSRGNVWRLTPPRPSIFRHILPGKYRSQITAVGEEENGAELNRC